MITTIITNGKVTLRRPANVMWLARSS